MSDNLHSVTWNGPIPGRKDCSPLTSLQPIFLKEDRITLKVPTEAQ
jgi:hypothetical protein